MTTSAWVDDPFFPDPESESVDGGLTSHGLLWHAVSPRWGHSMHTMCSYHGMFPAKLAHYFIQRYTAEGDVVLDPFSGRGTTTLQASVEGRRTVSNDLSPLAYILTRAKSAPPRWGDVMGAVDALETEYGCFRGADGELPPDITMLYHPNTLRQLRFLREHLLARPIEDWSSEEVMIAGATAGILHGAHRRDGTSQYLSISMPNTFSMSPAYVRKFIRENQLAQPNQDVFERLRDKLARLYLDEVAVAGGEATRLDASESLTGVRPETVDLVLTSPPYLRVVNYGTSNWIRLWWLGLDEVSRNAGSGRRILNANLDHEHRFDSYCAFILRTLQNVSRVLSRSGVAVFVIGDVAKPGGTSLPLARAVWEAIGNRTGLRLLEVIEDSVPVHNKVSRIWGDTKGRATERDCVLVLSRSDGEPRTDNPLVSWDEPYKDGGPDAAHARVIAFRHAG